MDDELAEDRADLFGDARVHFDSTAADAQECSLLCGAPVGGRFLSTDPTRVTCPRCKQLLGTYGEKTVASTAELIRLRDRLGLLKHETAWQVLQRLTWLWQSPEAIATINQAIDDVEEAVGRTK